VIRDLPDERAVRHGLDLDDRPEPACFENHTGPTIEIDLDDEVTGGLRHRPWHGWMDRLDARTRSILTAAAIAIVIVNAGAAWAYWHIAGSAAGRPTTGTAVTMNLRGHSDLDRPLVPGGTGNLTVTVANDNDFPIRIASVAAGTGTIRADDEHREAGCVFHGVAVAHHSVKVRWNVPRNTVGAFTVPGGLTMAPEPDDACAGATFTVPVLVSGVAGPG
jgi:hypothetical protein